jgi:hypothetical protein
LTSGREKVLCLLGAVALAVFDSTSASVAAAPVASASAAAGEGIYRRGVLLSGAPLQATRQPDLKISGAGAACVNCHRRSGLGEIEGRISIPPISGAYLFHPRAADRDDFDLPFVDSIRPDREPYTQETLARAIREGVDASGKPLNYLMPHYDLSDSDLHSLIDYLKNLTPQRVPGVAPAVLDFATIITPDADPTRSGAMLDVLQHFFADKNAFSRAESSRLQSSHRMMFKANRRWQLHVWQLAGPPETWQRQLQEDLKREPVYAVISGMGGRTWAPVHRFCEQAALPCLFPNVDLPVVDEDDFYSLYFSKGVLLEAGLIGDKLTDRANDATQQRLIQVFRPDDIGAQAAAALAARRPPGFQHVDRVLPKHSTRATLRNLLSIARPDDVVVLWLRPQDLASLADVPVLSKHVFMSGIMGGLDNSPLPAAWRGVTEMSYPFDLPDRRRVRMDYPLGWFHIRQIPLVDERVQADTYLACGLLAETLSHMADSFIRDYLVERVEGMLEHRILTAYYPRLALAPHQRFASKGGYLVRFADNTGSRIVPDGEWVAP